MIPDQDKIGFFRKLKLKLRKFFRLGKYCCNCGWRENCSFRENAQKEDWYVECLLWRPMRKD